MMLVPAAVLLGVLVVGEPVLEDVRVVPDATQVGRLFGRAVAVGGGRAAVAYPLGSGGDPREGDVLVYDAVTGAELWQVDVAALGVEEFFPASLAFAGDALLVGAPSPNIAPDAPVGRVHVFDAATGVHRLTIVPEDPQSLAFGYTIAVDGDAVLVGAADRTFVHPRGAAFLYDIDDGRLMQTFGAGPDDGVWSLGHAVAIEGGRVAVAAKEGAFATGLVGAVLLFDAQTGVRTGRLADPAPDPDRVFGSTLAASNGVLAAGSAFRPGGPFDDVGLGSVSLFGFDDGALRGTIEATNAGAFEFGSFVATRDGVLLVGANGDSGRALLGGSVWAFETDTLLPIAEFGPAVPGHGERFGWQVAVDDGRVWIGAPHYGSSGAAYGFGLPLRCPADFNGDRRATSADVGVFVDLFSGGAAGADLADPRGRFDFFDVAEFLRVYQAGCE